MSKTKLQLPHKPGKYVFDNAKTRKNASWFQIEATQGEFDVICGAVGRFIGETDRSGMPFATILSRICKQWMREGKANG